MEKEFVPNKPLEKVRNSVVHILILGIIFYPVTFFIKDIFLLKILFLLLVFIAQIVFVFLNNGRTLSHVIFKTYHKEKYKNWQWLVWSIFYTVSVASILFWVYFPFDLLILNLIIQYITYLIAGTTLHQLLAGKMITGTYKSI
ncbi:MAG: hypothetical protein AAB438_00205 [Patescibacteria group bacterium]